MSLAKRIMPEELRSERLEARLPSELKELFSRAAAFRGQTLTDFVVSTVAETARQVIRDHDAIQLTERDQHAFAAALLQPPPASDRLKAAADWYREQQARDA